MMLDVGGGLLEVEGRELVADGDALVEGLVGGEAELVGQVRLTDVLAEKSIRPSG
jgi:hypothetical protein